MTVSAIAHLNFAGNARQALEFYGSVFDAEPVLSTYGQGGVPRDSATGDQAVFEPLEAGSPWADKIAFGLVAAPSGLRLAAYDVFGAEGDGLVSAQLPGARNRGEALTHTQGFFLALYGQTVEEVTELWHRLGDGGTVVQALVSAPWAPAYGMLTDRFGVTWIFGVTPA